MYTHARACARTYICTYIHTYMHTYYAKSQDGVAPLVTRLHFGESRVQIPAGARDFLILQNVYALPLSSALGARVLYWGKIIGL
jgi:hypothetical protein